MWRAAGGPAYRRPTIWLDMEETKRFRAHARWAWTDIPDGMADPNVTHGDIWDAEADGLVVSAQELMLNRRRPFSDRSQALMRGLIGAKPYEGHCPCCHAAQVLGAGGHAAEEAEYDHFFHRGLNRPEHGWLICRACHLELTHGGYLARFGRMAEFRRFQTLILDARRQEAKGRTRRPALDLPPLRQP